jgi:hypothetical protein
MQVREAKDFLVQQTAEQARIEAVALSELEKRMMYFTESGEMREDFLNLNEEFEAEYDTDEYEAKIAKLLGHAYKRAGKENDETRRRFDTAIKCLRRGDHYLLVMWDMRPASNWLRAPDRNVVIGWSLGALILAGFYAIRWSAGRFTPPNAQTVRIIQGILVILILGGILFPRAVQKVFEWILENTVDRLMGGKSEE